jgi:hypothetical protein
MAFFFNVVIISHPIILSASVSMLEKNEVIPVTEINAYLAMNHTASRFL